MQTYVQTEKSSLKSYEFHINKILEKCIQELESSLIRKPEIIVFGKKCYQQRSVGFFSDKSIGYKYSNKLTKSIPLTSNLKILLDKVNNFMKSEFNGILVNKYLNGNDYISDHSDNEKNLDHIGVVSISYGAVRKFRIRDKKTKKIIIDIPTCNNQILHMKGDFQKEFTHGIPLQKKIKECRYSFTFRKHKK